MLTPLEEEVDEVLLFYPKRTFHIFPIYIIGVVSVYIISLSAFIRNMIYGYFDMSTIYTLIFITVWLFLPYPIVKEADKAGYYVRKNTVIWRNNFFQKEICVRDIEGIVISNNDVYKTGGLGAFVPTFETVKTKKGKEYVYAMTIVTDMSRININHTSIDLFIRDNRNIAIGSAIYSEEFIEYLLRLNNNIRVIKSNGIICADI